jgi:hypothetical protein
MFEAGKSVREMGRLGRVSGPRNFMKDLVGQPILAAAAFQAAGSEHAQVIGVRAGFSRPPLPAHRAISERQARRPILH